jgi:hypothetical protein
MVKRRGSRRQRSSRRTRRSSRRRVSRRTRRSSRRTRRSSRRTRRRMKGGDPYLPKYLPGNPLNSTVFRPGDHVFLKPGLPRMHEKGGLRDPDWKEKQLATIAHAADEDGDYRIQRKNDNQLLSYFKAEEMVPAVLSFGPPQGEGANI